jgi:N-acetyl-anhydromuramyl-L-alanine amidase AmpD
MNGEPAAGLALDPLFDEASREFNVPADLLKAISFTETRWNMVRGEKEFEGLAPAFGMMALRGEALERGAALAGVSAEAVRTELQANLRAGAALLSAHADELRVNRADLGAWAPAVARLSGIGNTDALAEHVHRGVYATLRGGVVVEGPDGKVIASIMPTQVEAQFARPSVRAMVAGPDYASSVWRPSPNHGARASSPGIKMIVLHTCEGGYAGCWGWLTSGASSESTHYVVSESGHEVSQLVAEADNAFHMYNAAYNCSLNGGRECYLNGLSVSHFSVGIHLAGFAAQASFATGQIDASAKLACDIARDQAITIDSYHLVPHSRLQPDNRKDPGPNWPWPQYFSKINTACNGGLVIDDANEHNNASLGYFEASLNWPSSTAAPGYFGSGASSASTQYTEDPAIFWFYLSAPAAKAIDAWWVAGADRSTSTPFVIKSADGYTRAQLSVNQQINGGRWNALGVWNFAAGWNKVEVHRRAPLGYKVVADAIRIR